MRQLIEGRREPHLAVLFKAQTNTLKVNRPRSTLVCREELDALFLTQVLLYLHSFR